MSTDKRDAERAARRAGRLARRAEERARRKGLEAARAAEHAAQLAARAAEELAEYEGSPENMGFEDEPDEPESRRQAGHRRKTRRRYGYGRDSFRRRRSRQLYRDRQGRKILGVCAGIADYLGRPAWAIRLLALLGLFFAPSVTIPAYFIIYFLTDDKPYYRRVTDRFEETEHRHAGNGVAGARRTARRDFPANNVQAMKMARAKFSDIEQRLRRMETHVTSSRFELQREFKKISGE